MKIKEVVTTDDEYNETVTIYIDGEEVFSVGDGECEDNTLGRNFDDCHNVGVLMRSAHAAGLRGEPLEYEAIHISGEVE